MLFQNGLVIALHRDHGIKNPIVHTNEILKWGSLHLFMYLIIMILSCFSVTTAENGLRALEYLGLRDDQENTLNGSASNLLSTERFCNHKICMHTKL